MVRPTAILPLLGALLLAAPAARTQEAQRPASETVEAPAAAEALLALELNALQPLDEGCRITMVARNATGAPIGDLVLEVAVFDASGAVDRLLRLDFGALFEGKTRVRQFDLKTRCEAIGRIVLNDVPSCTGGAIKPPACLRAVRTRSAVAAPFTL